MKAHRLTYLLSTLGSIAISACGSANSSTTPSEPLQTSSGKDSPTQPVASLPDGPATHVRIAHLSPGAPAVDVCVAPHGTDTFVGPVLAGVGDAKGLSYGSVTRYLAIPAGAYDVRIVAPGSASCSENLGGLPDFTDLPSLDAGSSATLAAEGEIGSSTEPFGIKAYIDEATTASGTAKLRFIHASPGTPAVDVGIGGGVLFTSVFTDVSFGDFAASGVDQNGYFDTAPLAGVDLSARVHGALDDVLSIDPASLPAGAIATAFAVGKIGSTSTPLRVLLCVDNAPPNGALSSCSLVGGPPSLGYARIAHLSPDAPNVDVCLRTAGAAAFTGKPLLASLVGTGIVYPEVTTYVPLPAGSYDVRITATGNCDAGAVPDTLGVNVPLGIHATVAAVGDLSPAGSDPAFQLKVFPDDAIPSATAGELRFIHASPGAPAVDIGLRSTTLETHIFSDVSFGQVGQDPLADANGYLPASPFADDSISAVITATKVLALRVSGVSLSAGSLVTTFAVGGKTGDTMNPLQILVCDDSAAPKGLFTVCSALSGT
jgi:Domain of unknown function (DUF4397)